MIYILSSFAGSSEQRNRCGLSFALGIVEVVILRLHCSRVAEEV